MDKLIRQSWWKAVAVLILLYVFVAGLLVPLKPNITTVELEGGGIAVAGKVAVLEVTGYNTHFVTAGDELQAWLLHDQSATLPAAGIEVVDEQIARLTFQLPEDNPGNKETISASLVMDSPVDGFFVRPSALTVGPATLKSENTRITNWENSPPKGLHTLDGVTYPFRNILAETIRNTYFHVSLWLAMMLIFIAAVVYAVKYLRLQGKMNKGKVLETELTGVSPRERADYWSQALTGAGLLFGLIGLTTGMLWGKYTWGSWWSWDIKQFTTLIALLIYAGYFVLRSSFSDPEARGRIGAVYNIFAFAALIPLIYVLPRLSDSSLHPGNGGNPALGGEDLDNTMRMVFYPAVIAWTLMGGWLASVLYRIRRLEQVRKEALDF